MTEGILNSIKDRLTSTFNSFDKLANDACNVLTGGDVLANWSIAQNFAGAFSLFCNVIIGICMLIELSKIFSKVDVLKWEHGLKVGVKVVLAKVCVEQAPTFLEACYNQACSFVTYMADPALGGTDVAIANACVNAIGTRISGISGLGSAIGLLVSVTLVEIGIKICGVLIVVMAYGRIFEILVYVAISPVPCAFLPLGEGDNLSRIPMKFFKNFIAVCLQGVMMFVCIKLFGSIITTAFTNKLGETILSGASDSVIVSDICYDVLLYTVVLVMSITKCSSWAKSIIDAS